MPLSHRGVRVLVRSQTRNQRLKEEYGIKDVGKARFILGIQIHRHANGRVFLSQRAYFKDAAVGSLMYAMLGTRPDLAEAVGVLGRHANRPDSSHWAAAVCICQYLKGTLDYGIEYVPDDAPLVGFEAYSDSDWGACVDTARLTMGYAFVLASGTVSWLSKLQRCVWPSSTEAEYLGLLHALKEAVFLRPLLGKLGTSPPVPLPSSATTRALTRSSKASLQ
ncbi:hypothetical protein JCM3770_005842 [Rhodotorula araucariae]